MSVVVGGTDQRPGDSEGPKRPRGPALLTALACGVFAVVAFPAAPADSPPDSGFSAAPQLDTGGWVEIGTGAHSPATARRLGDAYVFVVPGGVGMIDASGTTTLQDLAPDFVAHRITSDGHTAVVHGRQGPEPVLWRSTDGTDWEALAVPWRGSIQAVAIRPEGLVVLGIDTDDGDQIVATEAEGGWEVTATLAPTTGLFSTGTGIVGRGRVDGGKVGYLYSTDAVGWEPVAEFLALSSGEVITLHSEAGASVARRPGVAGTIRPPELPIVAYWQVEDRHWLHTPTAIWWSRDGTRWSPLPLDRAHGFPGGSPVLLPFADRALLSVGGARGTPRTVYVWILGA